MAKKKKEEVSESGSGKEFDMEALAAKVGGEILDRTDTVKFWIDTGNLSLNHCCSGKYMGGGFPIGKIIEIWGNSSSCKTLYALNFIRGIQRVNGISVFIDVENTLNAQFAEKAAKVDTSKLLVISVDKVDTLERAFNQIHIVLREIETLYGKERPIIIVYDSIAASASQREFAETTVDMFKTSKAAIKEAGAGKDKPGEHAKTIGKELRKLNPVLNRMNCSVVIINQVREKIGVMWGNNETKAAGGRSLDYYCSLCLKTKASKKLKDERENIKGVLVSVENTKNKCFRPFVKSDNSQLLFDYGIDPLGGLLDSLYKQYRIDDVKGKKSYWKIRPEFTSTGEEAFFQASTEKNVVPPEVLIEHPKLIDAESSEQVKAYLDSFNKIEAMDLNEDDIKEGEEIEMAFDA
jgi:recombination protein RecA